jgi:hypothetical protein
MCTLRTSVYNAHMAEIQVKGWQCDVCGYIWLRVSVVPSHCPNRSCRSRRWNSGVSSAAEHRGNAGERAGSTPVLRPNIETIYERDEYSQ